MKTLLSLAMATLLCVPVFGQSCGCDVTIVKEGSYDGKYLNYQPGQTICLQAGTYKYLYFRNLIGSASAPIKLINCGGQVTVGTDAGQNGIQFWDSKYVYLSGRGSVQYAYGIKLTQTPANYSGVVVTGFSSNFEIEGLEVSGTGFAGMMIKQDPTCDPATWRGNFAMYNIKVHGNYIHDTGAEGLYIGSSFGNSGMVRTCNGISQTVYPHNIYGLKIYRNRIERTGAEGIQYACTPNAQVNYNTVRYAGTKPFDAYQNNGIQASGGVSGTLSNNIIQNAAGAGILLIGHSGTNLVYGNLITNVGEAGIFCDNREGTLPNSTVIFANNTLVKCGGDGFRLYNELDLTTVANNAVIEPATGKLIRSAPDVRVTTLNNYYISLLSNALSANVIDAGYQPLPGSPMVDKGIDVKPWGILVDLAGRLRLQGPKTDLGAYELPVANAARRVLEESTYYFAGEAVSEKESETNALREQIGEARVISYPSPCADELTIRLGDGSPLVDLTLYTSQGATLKGAISGRGTTEIRLQTHELPAGLYLFRVTTTEARTLPGRFLKR